MHAQTTTTKGLSAAKLYIHREANLLFYPLCLNYLAATASFLVPVRSEQLINNETQDNYNFFVYGEQKCTA
jgi:hypothetical protein